MIIKNKTTVLFYLIGFMIICLILFILWGSYRFYLVKHPPARPGIYACSPDGQCLLYPKQAAAELCPITFLTETCDDQCDNSINRCVE